ncbi:MAG: hypothetical protein WD270_03765 [Acetobacterales bacterium]
MTSPRPFLIRMVMFLIAVTIVGGLLFEGLWRAFMANPALNGLIVGVLLLGIIYNFRQVLRLAPEVTWIETYRRGEPGLSVQRPPQLLGAMATMLGERGTRLSLSTMSMRSLLDGIQSRLDESREISRYLIGLLIFLGLLGTFWGLLETVSSVSDVIAGLSVGAGAEATAVFSELKENFRAPLSGMGTAFSSSLFGLAGSLALGFLDLQAGQAQNRFYNDLEEWLSSLTRLSSGSIGGDGDHSVPAYVQALLEQTAENMESLQRILERGEESRITANASVVNLTERLSTLTDQMRTEQNLLVKLGESQIELKSLLSRLLEEGSSGGMDEATRNHIRNIEFYAARITEDAQAGREQVVREIRNEIKVLSRTIAAAADSAGR